MMYWPTSVNPYGAYLKDTEGKSNKGVNVQIICTNKNTNVIPIHFPNKRRIPTAHSQKASKIILTGPSINPKLSILMVLIARSSAGL